MAQSTGHTRVRIDAEVESLIVQMARENSGWGYDRIAGALANLGYAVSDQTIGNVLPARDRAGPETESDDGMEGLHCRTYVSAGRHGFLYR
jgi:hypothetical protein